MCGFVASSFAACTGTDPVIPASQEDAGGAPLVDAGPGTDAGTDADVPTLPVSGVVLSAAGGPLPNALVTIGGVSARTGNDGKFVLAAKATYDVSVVSPSQASIGKTGIFYRGLTSRAPTLSGGSLRRTASSLTAGMTGAAAGTFPIPGGSYERAAFMPTATTSYAEALSLFVNIGDALPKTFPSASVTWFGDPSLNGLLYGYRYTIDPTTALPASFEGIGSVPINLDEGATASIDVPMAVPTVSNVTLSVQRGTATARGLVYSITQRPGGYLTFSTAAVPDSATLPLPSAGGGLSNGKAMLQASFEFADGSGALAFAGELGANANVVLRAPARGLTGLAPAEGATGVGPGTELRWEAAPPEFPSYYVLVYCTTSGFQTGILTDRTSVTIPDLSADGLPFPSAASCSWYVFGLRATLAQCVEPATYRRFISGYRATGEGQVLYSKVLNYTSK